MVRLMRDYQVHQSTGALIKVITSLETVLGTETLHKEKGFVTNGLTTHDKEEIKKDIERYKAILANIESTQKVSYNGEMEILFALWEKANNILQHDDLKYYKNLLENLKFSEEQLQILIEIGEALPKDLVSEMENFIKILQTAKNNVSLSAGQQIEEACSALSSLIAAPWN